MPLDEALGRVLRCDLQSRHDVPNTRCAAMDGFAVRAAEVSAAPLPAGAFAPIDTGEPVPDGFDAVVPVEVAELVGDRLAITGRVSAGDHVRPAAEDIAAGAVVLRAGAVIDPYAIGVAAATGHAMLAVRRRARVAVLATGDEIRPAGEALHRARRPTRTARCWRRWRPWRAAAVTRIRRASTTRSCSRARSGAASPKPTWCS